MFCANDNRYDKMIYNRCGKSGLKLPAISLGLWQNFGFGSDLGNAEKMCHTAFNEGITHFDLANNYGHPFNGSAEENFGVILKHGFGEYRDEMIISTKAGYGMWEGPYGNQNGSRKYLVASLDQSLKRMGLDYVDIFYHHVFDPETPLEETAYTLDSIVRSGKALYVGISNYNKANTQRMIELFKQMRTPYVVNQPSYSMLNRWIEEDGLKDYASDEGFGLAVFSPLHQGLLTNKYLHGIPDSSRAGKGINSLSDQLDDEMVCRLNKLNAIAENRGQSLAQMALSWILLDGKVTTVLTGASSSEQILDNIKSLDNLTFTKEELSQIDELTK